MKLYNSKKYLLLQLKKKSYIQIAKENDVSTKTIQRRMTKFSLTKKRIYWTKKEVELLKKEYSINSEVYKLFKRKTVSSINHKASKLKLKKIKRKGKYTINSNFFKKWSNEMAYVLGWFFSDGNVSSDGRHCSIHLNSKDKDILYKIKKVMNSTHPVELHESYVYFRVYDAIICSDLIELGCVPRKSLVLKFPLVPNKYVCHFIRGYFDGDGNISINYPNTIKIRFVSTKKFISALQSTINKKLDIKPHKIQKNSSIYGCSYYGNDARKLALWMYKNSENLFLKRKKTIFDIHIKKWNKKYVL